MTSANRVVWFFISCLLLSSCAHSEKRITDEAIRQPSSEISSFAEYLQKNDTYHLIFFGTQIEFNEFIQKAQRDGYKIIGEAMVGEIVGNGIDDNGDGFIDNAYGWDAANNRPFDSGFGPKSSPNVPLQRTPNLDRQWIAIYPILFPQTLSSKIAVYFPIVEKLNLIGLTPIVTTNPVLAEAIIAALNSAPPFSQWKRPLQVLVP